MDKRTRNVEIMLKVLRQGKTVKLVAPEYGISTTSVSRFLLQECRASNPIKFKNGEKHKLTQHRPFPPTLNYLRRHKEHFLWPIEAIGYTVEWMEHGKEK